jgi:type I restriction enzyme S subunit
VKLPAYPSYKPTGVEWLGDVPEHWEVKRLKYLSEISTSGVWGEDSDHTESGYPVATTANISPSGAIDVASMHIRALTAEEVRKGLCRPGDIIVVKSSGSATSVISGKCALVRTEHGNICFSNFTLRVRPLERILHPFFAWSFLSSEVVRAQVRLMVSTTTYPNLQVPEYVSFLVPQPPPREQLAIADFLDRETGRIDRLVGKKRELIERLKEKRAALIACTVTRGLPPTAARSASLLENPTFKPSGLDELPQIPKDWKVSKVWLERVARNLEYQDGNHGELHPKAEDYVSDGIPFIMANHIVAGEIDFTICNYIEPELAASLRIGFARTGDVLLTHKGTIGRVGLVQENRFPYVVLTPQVTYYRFLRNIFGRYLFWFFQGSYWQDQMYLVSSLGTTRGYVGLLDQRSLNLILPRFPEQVTIATYLDEETAKLDALVARIEEAIERLREYRTALITAAVTGKIDVRKTAS